MTLGYFILNTKLTWRKAAMAVERLKLPSNFSPSPHTSNTQILKQKNVLKIEEQHLRNLLDSTANMKGLADGDGSSLSSLTKLVPSESKCDPAILWSRGSWNIALIINHRKQTRICMSLKTLQPSYSVSTSSSIPANFSLKSMVLSMCMRYCRR